MTSENNSIMRAALNRERQRSATLQEEVAALRTDRTRLQSGIAAARLEERVRYEALLAEQREEIDDLKDELHSNQAENQQLRRMRTISTSTITSTSTSTSISATAPVKKRKVSPVVDVPRAPLLPPPARLPASIPVGCPAAEAKPHSVRIPEKRKPVTAHQRKTLVRQQGDFRLNNANEKSWELMFAKLRVFKDKHGHSNVSTIDEQERQLGSWVSRQRVDYKHYRQGKPRGGMRPERIRRLEEIGFNFKLSKTAIISWEGRLTQLKEFKLKHLHCNVSQTLNPDAPAGLANWVSKQRQMYKNMMNGNVLAYNVLTADRISSLEETGFEWSMRATAKGTRGPVYTDKEQRDRDRYYQA